MNTKAKTKSRSQLMAERGRAGRRVSHDCGGESPVEQSHKEACDINVIVKRGMANNGMAMGVDPSLAKGLDLSNLPSYHEALNQVIEAEDAFMGLAPEVRKEFDHDPQKMIDFLMDEGNRERATELGLVQAPEPIEPVQVHVTNSPTPSKEE